MCRVGRWCSGGTPAERGGEEHLTSLILATSERLTTRLEDLYVVDVEDVRMTIRCSVTMI